MRDAHDAWVVPSETAAHEMTTECNLPGYVGFSQFLRNFHQQNACEQAELILRAALDRATASRARREEFVKYPDHFDLLQNAIN